MDKVLEQLEDKVICRRNNNDSASVFEMPFVCTINRRRVFYEKCRICSLMERNSLESRDLFISIV